MQRSDPVKPDDPVTIMAKVIEDHGDEVVVEVQSLRGSVMFFVPRKHMERAA